MFTPAANRPASALSPLLHEALLDLAAAVQRRAIYPPSHPMLRGAVAGVHGRVSACLTESENIDLGVAGRKIVAEGAESSADHPHLGEFAARLTAHQIGGVRILAGVTEDELGRLVDVVAGSPDAAEMPLARRDDLEWRHIELRPIAFGRLGLLDDEETGPAAGVGEAWRALASTAFSNVRGDLASPAEVAGAILSDLESSDPLYERFEALLLAEAGERQGATGGPSPTVGLVEALGVPGLARVLMGLGRDRANELVAQVAAGLPASAVVALVQAAAVANASVVSTSMLRLLQKLGGGTGVANRPPDRIFLAAVRRLLHAWTLDSPNPHRYDGALGSMAVPRTRGADRRRDAVEPERLVDLAIEVGETGPSVEAALGRLAMRDGLAATTALLGSYPQSATRDLLVDRLLNESSLREQLAQPVLDAAFLRQAVDRLRSRAIGPLLDALPKRDDAGAAFIVELLAALGWDVLAPVGERVPSLPSHVLRHLVALFESLEAWPPQVDPMDWMRHPDFLVRRETIKHLLKDESTREAATLAALRDPDTRVFAIGLHAIAATCSQAAAREVMRRYGDTAMTGELRVRAIRAAASSRTGEVAPWLASLVRRKRRWFRSAGLVKPSAETVAAIGALAQWYALHPMATELLALARESKSPEYRRAAAAPVSASHA